MPKPAPRILTHDGRTQTLQEWARETGINAETIRSRIDHQGWDIARALTTGAAGKFAPRGKAPVPPPRPCPKMIRHKPSGRACARWRTPGKENVRYFGAWGSEEAAAAYQRFQVEWASGGGPANPGGGASVAELVVGYLEHVGRYYVKDGKPTSEVHAQRAALRVLSGLYADLPAAEFKPKHLKACQQAMVAKSWARGTVNQHTWRLTRCFSWGVAEELVPAAVADALAHVPNLQAGRTTAPDPDPVMSVPAERVAATLPHLDPDPARRAVLAGMIQFQELTGARPGELCAMTAGAVDTSDKEAWVYRVRDKNTHRQTKRKPRLIWIGPKAQEVLRPFLADPGPSGRLWCYPPRWPKSKKARRVPLTTGRYSEAVRDACAAAQVEPWTPHQLRHNRATEVKRRYESDEAAAAAIGDTPEVTRAVYADPNEAIARRIAIATG